MKFKMIMLCLLILCVSGCADTTPPFPRCNYKAPLHYIVYESWNSNSDNSKYIQEEAMLLGWINVDYYAHLLGAKYSGEIKGSCPLSHELPQ